MNYAAAKEIALRNLDNIALAWRSGQKARALRLIRKYFASRATKLVAAHQVLAADARAADASMLATSFNFFAPARNPVLYWRKPKRSSGYRIICSLPHELAAANYVVKDVLEALFSPGRHVFSIKRRGRDKEALEIREALEQGYKYVFNGDLRDAYPSVSVDSLYALPLPRSVVRYALDYRNMEFLYSQEKEVAYPSLPSVGLGLPGRNGPRGLLQGSPSSDLILAWLFNDLPSVLPDRCLPFLLTDNILVVTRRKRDRQRIERALHRYFDEHHAGPFVLGSREQSSIKEGFERAGYQYETAGDTLKNWKLRPVIVCPSHANFEMLYGAIIRGLRFDVAQKRLVPTSALENMERSLSGFSAWSGIAEFKYDQQLDLRYELHRCRRLGHLDYDF